MHLFTSTEHLCGSEIQMYVISESGSRRLDQTYCTFLWCNTSLCDGMKYNSAKNMTYIPNEGVDMGIGIVGRSTVQIAILWISLLLET